MLNARKNFKQGTPDYLFAVGVGVLPKKLNVILALGHFVTIHMSQGDVTGK